MNKILLSLFLLLILVTLSSCEESIPELDYIDFVDHIKPTYVAMESIEDERYISYYYGATCGHCEDVKQSILGFFYNFDQMPFYILEVGAAQDVTILDEFLGTPTVFVMANGEVLESYIGVNQIYEFIEKYNKLGTNDFVYEYDMFKNQHLTTYDAALEIDSEAYIIYYYLEDCPHCIRTKPDFLKWAWERDIDEIYFMNGAQMIDPDNKPTELIVLNSGTPILVVMKNGEFAKEYYSGREDVLEYINELGKGEITTEHYTE